MKRYYDFEGLNLLNKGDTYGRCVADTIEKAIEFCQRFGIAVYSIKNCGFTQKELETCFLELKEGKKPSPIVRCWDCIHAKKCYRETAGDDVEYYQCTLMNISMDTNDYCSKGVRKR